MKARILPVLTISMAVLSGCADPKYVLFVTTTQIGIDADSKTQSANIGYERYEGFVGPGYESGGVPPVIARLKSNLSMIDPKISQIYATGDAARLASGGTAKWEPKPLSGQRRIMFFGTGTNFGLKATFSTQAPAFSLGYKRQEFSLIPIGTKTTGATLAPKKAREEADAVAPRPVDGSEDVYLSVLAAFDLNVANKTFQGTGVGVSQFFATGDAAETLAMRPDIQAVFDKEAENALNIRAIDCVDKPDAASAQIMSWLLKNTKHKNTLTSIVASEFGDGVTNWELINCENFAAKRLLVLKRHDMAP